MQIDVLYVFESTKFATTNSTNTMPSKVESVILVSGAAPGAVLGSEVVLEPGVYRVTNPSTLQPLTPQPSTDPTFLVSTFDKGTGLPDPPGKIVAAFTSSSTTPALVSAGIKKELSGQGSRGTV